MAGDVTDRGLAAGLIVAAVLAARVVGRVQVAGDSMRPTLLPGDRLLVRRGGRLGVGDLVVLRDPRPPHREVVKRLVGLPGDTVDVRGRLVRACAGRIVVLGDNAGHSTDSRQYGPVSRRLVRGRAWYRYAPASRVGLLGRAGSSGRG